MTECEEHGVYNARKKWLKEVGPIPEGYELDHKCRNIRCENRDHLQLIPMHGNRLRGTDHPNFLKTHCPKGHEYSADNVYINVHGGRVCKVCRRVNNIENQRRRRVKLMEKPHEWVIQIFAPYILGADNLKPGQLIPVPQFSLYEDVMCCRCGNKYRTASNKSCEGKKAIHPA